MKILNTTDIFLNDDWQNAINLLSKWANGKNVAIAGGIFSSHECSDVDIYMYGISENTMYEYIKLFMDYFNTDLEIYTNCVSAIIDDKNYQLIIHKKDNIENIIGDFDFDVCKIAYDFKSKNVFVDSQKTIHELRTRTLTINKDNISPRFYYRFKKYVSKKGFNYVFDGIPESQYDGYSINIPLNEFTVIKLDGKLFISSNLSDTKYTGSGGVYLKKQLKKTLSIRKIKKYKLISNYKSTDGLLILDGDLSNYIISL